MALDEDEIERRFSYHNPTDTTRGTHDIWRGIAHDLARHLNNQLPDSREKSLAFTALEEMSFWVHACIARNFN
jgi:hypothetical protein